MNKTIKVIDLLNMIANGEEVPKKIKYGDNILKYNEDIEDYEGVSIPGTGSFFNYLFVNEPTGNFINDTVAIIEEQPEIDIQSIDILRIELDKNGIATKIINQLVQAVKQLDKTKSD